MKPKIEKISISENGVAEVEIQVIIVFSAVKGKLKTAYVILYCKSLSV